jgi:hypothetical protein
MNEISVVIVDTPYMNRDKSCNSPKDKKGDKKPYCNSTIYGTAQTYTTFKYQIYRNKMVVRQGKDVVLMI